MEDSFRNVISNAIINSINPVGYRMYHAMYAVGFILMTLFNVFINYKIFNYSRLRALIYSVFTFGYAYLMATLIGYLFNFLTALKTVNTSYIIRLDMIGTILFVLLLIPTAFAEKYFFKLKNKRLPYINGKRVAPKIVSVSDTLDFVIPGGLIFLSCIKIGCYFGGCCFGVECSWGVHSFFIGTTVFPIQLFEAATIWLIMVAVYFIQQTKFYRRGMAAPLAGGMYIFARFCWEFLRYYTPEMRHFFLGLSLWQIFCVIIFIVVVVWVIGLYVIQPSEPMPKNYLFAKKAQNKKR